MRSVGQSRSILPLGKELNYPLRFHWRNNMPIRVILGDDHELVRQGLKALLEREGFQVAGAAANGQEVIRIIPDIRPEVGILDVSLPHLNGIDAARELLNR